MQKKLLITILSAITLTVMFSFTTKVSAASPTPVGSSSTIVSDIVLPIPQGMDTIPEIISTVSGILFPVIGLILFAMIIYGGVTKLTAAGDADKEKQAMQILKNAIIGTVIIVLARVIVDTISALLGLPRL